MTGTHVNLIDPYVIEGGEIWSLMVEPLDFSIAMFGWRVESIWKASAYGSVVHGHLEQHFWGLFGQEESPERPEIHLLRICPEHVLHSVHHPRHRQSGPAIDRDADGEGETKDEREGWHQRYSVWCLLVVGYNWPVMVEETQPPTSNALPSVTAIFVFVRNIPASMTVCTILFTGAPCDHLTFLTCSDQVVWCLVLEDLRMWNSSWKWSPTSLEVSKSNGATQIHRSAMHPRMASTCRWRTSWGNGPFKRVSLKPFERSGATDPTGTGWHRPYESNSSLASWGHGQAQFFRGCFWGRDKPCRA